MKLELLELLKQYYPNYVLVPKEPTLEMLELGHQQIDFNRTGQNTWALSHPDHIGELGVGTTIETDMRDAWRAMLAAAPVQKVTVSATTEDHF